MQLLVFKRTNYATKKEIQSFYNIGPGSRQYVQSDKKIDIILIFKNIMMSNMTGEIKN